MGGCLVALTASRSLEQRFQRAASRSLHYLCRRWEQQEPDRSAELPDFAGNVWRRSISRQRATKYLFFIYIIDTSPPKRVRKRHQQIEVQASNSIKAITQSVRVCECVCQLVSMVFTYCTLKSSKTVRTEKVNLPVSVNGETAGCCRLTKRNPPFLSWN